MVDRSGGRDLENIWEARETGQVLESGDSGVSWPLRSDLGSGCGGGFVLCVGTTEARCLVSHQ